MFSQIHSSSWCLSPPHAAPALRLLKHYPASPSPIPGRWMAHSKFRQTPIDAPTGKVWTQSLYARFVASQGRRTAVCKFCCSSSHWSSSYPWGVDEPPSSRDPPPRAGPWPHGIDKHKTTYSSSLPFLEWGFLDACSYRNVCNMLCSRPPQQRMLPLPAKAERPHQPCFPYLLSTDLYELGSGRTIKDLL